MRTTSASFHDHIGLSLSLAQGESDVEATRGGDTVDHEQ